MIAFAKVDGSIKEPEYNFLTGVATHLGGEQAYLHGAF